MVVYCAAGGNLCHKSFCFISDYLNHDAQSVHSFIQALVPKIRDLSRLIRKFLFFSDGGPAHYKNRYNFANLSFFTADFDGLTAKWFFRQVVMAKILPTELEER